VAKAEYRLKHLTKPERPVYIKDLLLRIRTSNGLQYERPVGKWRLNAPYFETVEAEGVDSSPDPTDGPTSLKDLCLALLPKDVVTKTAMREVARRSRPNYVPIEPLG
jgi:hypothetical protein